jgi:hypothetical protein
MTSNDAMLEIRCHMSNKQRDHWLRRGQISSRKCAHQMTGYDYFNATEVNRHRTNNHVQLNTRHIRFGAGAAGAWRALAVRAGVSHSSKPSVKESSSGIWSRRDGAVWCEREEEVDQCERGWGGEGPKAHDNPGCREKRQQREQP